jgi:hypothetical protein
MPPYPILFNQTPETLRRIGARGGRVYARNWRARQRQKPAAHAPAVSSTLLLSLETTAQAIATLDAQFPWLCRCEKRS